MLNAARVNKLIKILYSGFYRKALLQHGVAAAVEHSSILNWLRKQKFKTVVDIGANRGQFALVARRCYPGARIIAFEPLKEPATIFRRVFSSDPLVVLNEIAVGSIDDNMMIHVSAQDDSSSLLPISPLQRKLFPGTDEIETRIMRVKRLDAILSKKDLGDAALLKLDVQGFERDVLEGSRALLPAFTYLYSECSFVELYSGQSLAHEVISFLHGFGFLLSGIYNLCYDRKGLAIQGDFLFKNINFPA